MQMSPRRSKAYSLVAALLLLVGAFLYLNDAVASWWAAGFPAHRVAYVQRFYWDISCFGLLCALAVGWRFRIWLKRRRIKTLP